MPARPDFDPLEIPSHILPGILLIDVLSAPRRFRYRLVGTRDVERRGKDPTGQDVATGFYGPDASRAIETYVYVATAGKLLYRNDLLLDAENVWRAEERLFLPLAADGKTVNMILVYVVW